MFVNCEGLWEFLEDEKMLDKYVVGITCNPLALEPRKYPPANQVHVPVSSMKYQFYEGNNWL